MIGADGEQLGIVSIQEAQAKAYEAEKDLCLLNPNGVPPVCKIMDYGKYKYEQGKKEKEMKKSQKVVTLKEVKLSPVIDIGDMQTKAKQTINFAGDGNKIKVSIRMRGRQQSRPEISLKIMSDFFEMVSEACVMEKEPKQEGQNLYMILVPKKKIITQK